MDDFQDEYLKSKSDIIASYQQAIIDVLVEKVNSNNILNQSVFGNK